MCAAITQEPETCPICDGPMITRANGKRCRDCDYEGIGMPANEPAQPDMTEAPGSRAPARIGRSRSFLFGLVAGILTLGLYWIYWQWVVFTEIHLDRGTRHRTGLFWTALACGAAGVVVGVVARVRQGAEVETSPTQVTLSAVAVVLLAVYLVREAKALEDLLPAIPARGAASSWLLGAGFLQLIAVLLPGAASLAVIVIWVPIAAVGFFLLQSDLNRYWATPLTVGPLSSGLTS